MPNLNRCPKCRSEHSYQDRDLWICAECAHEWTLGTKVDSPVETQAFVVKDAYGSILNDGDSVSIIKDLKVKGASSSVKIGTKVKNIHLVESGDGHNIDCKIDGFGSMSLKSEFVKKI